MTGLHKWSTYLGAAVVVYGLCWAYGTWRSPSWEVQPLGWPLLYTSALILIAYSAGIPDVVRERRDGVLAAIATVLGATLCLSVCQLVAGARLLPRWVILGSITLLIPWFVACAMVSRRTASSATRTDRVVVVGDPSIAAEIAEELDGSPERPAVVVGAMTVDEARDLVSGASRFLALVRATRATVIVLGHDASVDEVVISQASQLHQAGIRVRTVAMFYEEWLGKLPVSHLERVALMFDIGEVHRTLYGRFRRIFDVPAALVGFIVLVVITPVVLLGNLVGNRGPLLFRQPRVGRNGREFQILKFRSMQPSGDGAGAWTTRDDPRITRFGRLLRRTHVDELPQVINILRGDLAVIGPRPEQPHYVEQLSEKLPFYAFRLVVTPGLTSWGQVKCGYSASEEETLERLQYEFFHLRHQSFAFDCRVLLRTLRSVVGTQNPGR